MPTSAVRRTEIVEAQIEANCPFKQSRAGLQVRSAGPWATKQIARMRPARPDGGLL